MHTPSIRLQVSPLHAWAGEEVTITAIVENTGSVALDVRSQEAELLVDGALSLEWRLAIGNGPRTPGESALAAGERTTFQRRLALSGLRQVGEHELVLRVAGGMSPPVSVSIRPPGPRPEPSR
jgi:archaellum component FlaG (FlaF/FlaG flagellin family)